MLKDKIDNFLHYCQVSNFSDKSIESLSARLKEFKSFISSISIESLREITYQHLLTFVADFGNSSVHIKKARVWTLQQFFHFLKLNRVIDVNIAKDLPYPKIEKTVPEYLTIDEYNRILYYFYERVDFCHRSKKSYYHNDPWLSGAEDFFSYFFKYRGCRFIMRIHQGC